MSTPLTSASTSSDGNTDISWLPPIDGMALYNPVDTSHTALHAKLPDIMDPSIAAIVPVRQICCIGAGYVGK